MPEEATARRLGSQTISTYLRSEDANYNLLPIISAFNLIVIVRASQMGVPDKKGCLFPPSILGEFTLALNASLEAWKGFFANLHPVYKNLMVNIKICVGVVYVPNAHLSNAMIKYQQTLYGTSNPQSFYRHVRFTR
ncbi:hypothetical protein DFH11DRAFT_462458 [Phellopilus nigrolimitatus]|nr:hypothetical protein DFH11DRAFT_462458 [Phellopilus nigrolimitatus]